MFVSFGPYQPAPKTGLHYIFYIILVGQNLHQIMRDVKVFVDFQMDCIKIEHCNIILKYIFIRYKVIAISL